MTVDNTALAGAAAEFFDSFVAAFQSFDGARIAALYLVPSVALQADGSLGCLTSQSELARYFQAVVDGYRAQGFRACRYRDLAVTAIGARSALATVTWDLLRNDGEVLKSWRESYNLHRTDPGPWRIFASADHAE